MVEVRVYGLVVEPGLQLDLEGCEVSVMDLLTRLDIDPARVGIVTVDRRQSSFDELVPSDCRVCIFPLMSGG
jgi:hypothetical protein